MNNRQLIGGKRPFSLTNELCKAMCEEAGLKTDEEEWCGQKTSPERGSRRAALQTMLRQLARFGAQAEQEGQWSE